MWRVWGFLPPVVYLKLTERVSDKIAPGFITTIFPFNWLVCLSFLLLLKQRIKYKNLQYLHPGAGSSDEVIFRKALTTSNQGNVQVEMLSFLTTPGVGHLFFLVALVTPMIWCFGNLLILRSSWVGTGLVQARTFSSSGPTRLFSPWASVTEMPSAGCVGMAALRSQMC